MLTQSDISQTDPGLGAALQTRVARKQMRWGRVPPSNISVLAPVTIFIAFLIVLFVIAYLAHVHGPDLRLALYYPVPALAVTWLLGRRLGFAMAIFTSAVWYWAELHGVRYSNRFYAVLNTGSRLSAMLLGVYLLSALKQLTTQMAELVDQRTRALRDLTIRLSQAEESERVRLAHDVHDGLGQALTLLKLNLVSAISELASDSGRPRRLDDAVSQVTNLIERTRTLTFDLHPTMLDTLGLVPTLRHYAEQFSQQTHIDVTVSEEGQPPHLSTAISSYLFRSTKELMTNAAKHGKAKQIIVSVFWNPEFLRIIVDDDGSGFPTAIAIPGAVNSGIGLAGIRERVSALNGSLRIESGSASGSRIVLELPSGLQEIQ